MKLEVGKKYRARDGKVHGPLKITKSHPDRFTDEQGNWYGDDGRYWQQPPDCPFSLVSVEPEPMVDNLVTAALDAEEAFQSRARKFKIHNSAYAGVVVRVVEYPTPPDDPIDFSKPISADETLKYWDFGDEKMAKDFIRLQCWKAAALRLLTTGNRTNG